MSEEQDLIGRAQAGDQRALGDLLATHGRRLYRAVLLPRLGSAAAADDALAATYLEALRSFSSFDDRGMGMYPWLRCIALRVTPLSFRAATGELDDAGNSRVGARRGDEQCVRG